MNDQPAVYIVRFMGETRGPYSAEQLQREAVEGRLSQDTEIRHVRKTHWHRAKDVETLHFAPPLRRRDVVAVSPFGHNACSGGEQAQRTPQIINRGKLIVLGVVGFVAVCCVAMSAMMTFALQDNSAHLRGETRSDDVAGKPSSMSEEAKRWRRERPDHVIKDLDAYKARDYPSDITELRGLSPIDACVRYRSPERWIEGPITRFVGDPAIAVWRNKSGRRYIVTFNPASDGVLRANSFASQ